MADEQLEGEEELEPEVEPEQEIEQDEAGKKRGPNGWIPKVRFDEVLGKVHGLEATLQQEREARIRLEEQVKGKAEPTRYTKQQIREAVATGQLTQDQADDAWEAQLRADIKAEVVGEVKATTAETQTLAKIQADLAQYKTLAPDIMVEGSETRNEVAARYQYLLSIGAPRGAATELAAVNAVLGPVESLARKAKGRVVNQPHPESGGSGDGGKKPGGKKTLLDQAPARYQEHYKGLIAMGLATAEQVEKELGRIGIEKLTDRAKRYG